MEDKQVFIRRQSAILIEAELDITEKSKRIKDEVGRKIRELDSKTRLAIKEVRERFSKESKGIKETIKQLQERLDAYQNGVYSKYFGKVSISRSSFQASDDYNELIKNVEDAFKVLEQYEDTIRLHKFLVDLVKRTIRNACKSLVEVMSKLEDYSTQKEEESNKRIGEEIDKLTKSQHKMEDNIRNTGWDDIEEYLNATISSALHEIDGE